MYSLLSQLVQNELDKRQEEVKRIQNLLMKDFKDRTVMFSLMIGVPLCIIISSLFAAAYGVVIVFTLIELFMLFAVWVCYCDKKEYAKKAVFNSCVYVAMNNPDTGIEEVAERVISHYLNQK